MTYAGRQQMLGIPYVLPHQIQFQREVQGLIELVISSLLHPINKMDNWNDF